MAHDLGCWCIEIRGYFKCLHLTLQHNLSVCIYTVCHLFWYCQAMNRCYDPHLQYKLLRIRKQFLCMCVLSLSSEIGYSVNNYCVGHHGRVITDCHCTYERCIFFQSSAFGVQILFQAPRSQVVLSGRLCVCVRTNTEQCKK